MLPKSAWQINLKGKFPMIKLDEIDKQLLEILQKDSKKNVKEIADQLNLTKTPIYDRIKRFEKEGVIDKYVAVLDSRRIDSSMVVFCSVSLESQKLDEIETFSKAVEDIPEVIECYLMGGISDFLLKVIVKDLEAYHQFSSGKLAALPNVTQIRSTFVLNEVKRSSVIPLF
ncbi:MAG: DNA-binding Lrp family transcriptional regulator [Patiriisocius sp.]|jgi:DNA-binding Lrp family transcriptional regulator